MTGCDNCGGYGEVFETITPSYFKLVECDCRKNKRLTVAESIAQDNEVMKLIDSIQFEDEVVPEKKTSCPRCGYPTDDCGCPTKKHTLKDLY